MGTQPWSLRSQHEDRIELSDVLDSYKIRLIRTDDFMGLAKELKTAVGNARTKVSRGPRKAVLLWPNQIIAATDAADDDLLHEACHLVMAKEFSQIKRDCEGAGLLQLEYRIARRMSRTAEQKAANYRMETIVDHKQVFDTPFGKTRFLPVRPGYHMMRWWREGFERAIQLGVLDKNYDPTWKRRK